MEADWEFERGHGTQASRFEILARYQDTSNFIFARWFGGNWQLYNYNGGSATQIGVSSAYAWPNAGGHEEHETQVVRNDGDALHRRRFGGERDDDGNGDGRGGVAS